MSASGIRPWQVPIQWPQAPETIAERQALRSERLLKVAIVFAVLAYLVLDRFGVRVTSAFSVPPGMVAMYGLVAAMFLAGKGRLHPGGALTYIALIGAASLSFLVNVSFEPRKYVSVPSFLLLVVLYAPFAVALAPGAVNAGLWRWTVRMYVSVSLLLGVLGILQFVSQFFGAPGWVFDYMPLLPETLRASGAWNTVNYAGDWIKSNGFFMREPSMFSIAMAFAILCELTLERRKWVIAVLAAALLLTYSGSGLVCLAVGLLFPLSARSLLRAAVCALIAVGIVLVAGDALNLAHTLDRMNELELRQSSAYCRFVYPGERVLALSDLHLWTQLLGHGPGTMVPLEATCADGHQTTYAKALLEYGLAGVLAFGALILAAVNRSAAPLGLRVALVTTWLLLGGNLLTSEYLMLIYLLCAMWPEGIAAGERGDAAPAEAYR